MTSTRADSDGVNRAGRPGRTCSIDAGWLITGRYAVAFVEARPHVYEIVCR